MPTKHWTKRHHHPPTALAAAGLLLASSAFTHAQWVTESLPLKAGWNAVWLPLDVPHENILAVAPAAVEQIWRWNANEAGHFTAVPNQPDESTLAWNVWRRGQPEATTLNMLTGNAAYLVKVQDGTANFTWSVKGRPLMPNYAWSSSGLNLVGFPTQTPADAATRNFSRFFGLDAVLKAQPPVLYYNGGPLSELAPKNPLPVGSRTGTAVQRGVAYWVQSNAYTDFYGPIKVETTQSSGLNFGTELLSTTIRLKNVVDPISNRTITVTLSPADSESAPAGAPAVAGTVPLLVRGALNLATGQHDYAPLTAPITRVLPPQTETEIVFTVNRALLGNTPGSVFQNIVRITDSLNTTQINIPVVAETTSRAGLWSGAAVLTSVGHQRGTSNTPEAAPSQFPLRLLMHSDAAGAVRLLQQAYVGKNNGVEAVGSTEASFQAPSKAASRISTANFPVGTKALAAGTLGLGGTVTLTHTLAHNDASNPFIHAYHPDHDNMDPRFERALDAQRESPEVVREITLTFAPQNPLGFDPAWGSTKLGGTYTEVLKGLRAQPIQLSGTFVLQRVSTGGVFLNP